MKHVEVGPEGARLGYVELDGTGPPLVFLHGLGSSSPIYFARTATDRALSGRHVLMIDFFGFGISDRPSAFSYTIEEHADSIARALDTLDLHDVDLVAHSMGGAIALVLAHRRPDLVGRLVLAEPNLGPSPRPRIEAFTEQTFVTRGFAEALAAVGPQWAATMRLADPVALYRTELALGRGTTPPLGELLLTLAMPCTLIEGEHSAEHTADAALRAAGIPVLVVRDAGHTMMLDNPTGFAHSIRHALTNPAT